MTLLAIPQMLLVFAVIFALYILWIRRDDLISNVKARTMSKREKEEKRKFISSLSLKDIYDELDRSGYPLNMEMGMALAVVHGGECIVGNESAYSYYKVATEHLWQKHKAGVI